MLIDTHAHLNFRAYKNDADEVIKRALNNDIWMINVGSQYETSEKAVEIAEKYSEGVYAAVGLHPIHAKENFCVADYRNFIKLTKVVAMGEIGLDYKSEYISFKERQKEVFLEQLNLAEELNLPVIFHCRFAHNDLLEILNTQVSETSAVSQGNTKCFPSSKSQILNSNDQNSKLQGVIHCFTGNWEQAKQYLEMGFYLGFNGIIFKFNVDEIIRKMPLDKILLETDCPYLTPPQESGRNESLYIKHTTQKIAEIRNISYKEVADITTKNAKKLFKI